MALRHAIWAALLWLALGAVIALIAHNLAASRSGLWAGLWAGWLAAGAGSLTAFALLAWSHPRSVQSALGAVTVGFLARAVLLAVGLLAVLRQGSAPLGFTAAFFGTYLPLQGLEIAGALSVLKRDSLAPAAGAPR